MLKNRMKKWMPLGILLVLVVSLLCVSASAATTLTLLDGRLTITDSTGTGKESSGTVTITAGGGWSSSTNTITITNISDGAATLTFNYSVDNGTQEGFSSSSGTYSKLLSSQESATFKITSGGWWGTVTLTITNLSLVEAQISSSVVFDYDDALGSITADGSAVLDGATLNIPATGAQLVATAKSGATFLGWINESGVQLSKSATYTLKPDKDMKVKAVFVNASSMAWFLAGGDRMYEDLNAAATYANSVSDKKVILLNSGTLAKGDYTIPSGVTLLIPFDAANTLYTTQPASTGTTYTKPTIFRKLIMAEGAKITVNGAISLSAKYKSNSGEPSGPVSMIEMKAGSSITLESGGQLYAWGFITGAGEVVAKSGSKVYENMQFMDWRGGDQTTSIKNKVFPLSQYYIQNIEVPLTLHAGAKEYGFVSVTVKVLGEQRATPYLFGTSESNPENNPLFIISSGSLTKKYDGSKDRLVIEVNGTVSLGSLTLKMGIYPVTSSKYVLPLNGNMSIIVKSGGKVFVTGDIAFIPGTELTIDEGATVEFAETNQRIYIYDGDTWGTYCGSNNQKFKPLQYVPGRTYNRKESDLKDVSVLINGTVDARKAYIYTTSGGANIYSTGSGSITLGDPGTDTVTYQVIQASDPSNSTYVEIPITPAKLKNADGSFVATGDFGSGTYTYIDGLWHRRLDSNEASVCDGTVTETIIAATCTASGSKVAKCSCGVIYREEPISALGHNYSSEVTKQPACEEEGVKTYTCARCGNVYTESINALGHKEVVDAAKEPTCTETGLTEGKHCSVCGTVTVAQAVVPATGHSYGDWYTVTAATCTVSGLDQRDCKNCDHFETRSVAFTGHSKKTIPAVAPSCESTGLTAGTKCSVCGEILTAQEEVAALGHKTVTDPAVDPTCTTKGATAGSHCSRCDKVILAQETIPALGHKYMWFTVDGIEEYRCDRCQSLFVTVDLQYRLNDYIWMNAVLTIVADVDLGFQQFYSNGSGVEFVATNDGDVGYFVRRMDADELTKDLSVRVLINQKFVDIDLSFKNLKKSIVVPAEGDYETAEEYQAACDEYTKTIALVDKMWEYGEAAAVYFGKGTVEDSDVDQLPANLSTALTTGAGANKVNNYTIRTAGVEFTFNEQIGMTLHMGLKNDGVVTTFGSLSNVVQIGVLVGDALDKTTLYAEAGKFEKAYILYQTDRLVADSLSYPNIKDASYDSELVNRTKTWNDIKDLTACTLSFDLKSAEYSKTFALRLYIVVDNTPDNAEDEDFTVLYGTQYHYGLGNYIARTYNSTNSVVSDGYDLNAYKNFMVATWYYKEAAVALFGSEA